MVLPGAQSPRAPPLLVHGSGLIHPRLWRRPLPPHSQVHIAAREVRLAASVRDELDGGGGRRTGWQGAGGATLGVEESALEHYLRQPGAPWTRGVHLENALLLAMFTLLLWEPLFGTVEPCAFGGGLADAPLDLLEGGSRFYERRRAAIEATLEAIEGGEAPRLWTRAYQAHRGEVAIGVHWDALEPQLLIDAITAIGGRVVAAICRTLALDYVGSSHGAPDLLLLAPPTPEAPTGRARFVEVKGPGDALRDGQLAWIDALLRAGAEVEVAYVQAA